MADLKGVCSAIYSGEGMSELSDACRTDDFNKKLPTEVLDQIDFKCSEISTFEGREECASEYGLSLSAVKKITRGQHEALIERICSSMFKVMSERGKIDKCIDDNWRVKDTKLHTIMEECGRLTPLADARACGEKHDLYFGEDVEVGEEPTALKEMGALGNFASITNRGGTWYESYMIFEAGMGLRVGNSFGLRASHVDFFKPWNLDSRGGSSDNQFDGFAGHLGVFAMLYSDFEDGPVDWSIMAGLMYMGYDLEPEGDLAKDIDYKLPEGRVNRFYGIFRGSIAPHHWPARLDIGIGAGLIWADLSGEMDIGVTETFTPSKAGISDSAFPSLMFRVGPTLMLTGWSAISLKYALIKDWISSEFQRTDDRSITVINSHDLEHLILLSAEFSIWPFAE